MRSGIAVFTFWSLGFTAALCATEPPKYTLLELDVSSLDVEEIVILREELDCDHLPFEDGMMQVIAHGQEDFEFLARLRLPFQVLIDDMVSHYQSRLDASLSGGGDYGAWLNPPFGQGSMGGYYTNSEVISVLDQMANAYPGIMTTKASIGTTIQGRDIWAVKISDNPSIDEAEPEYRLDSLHHAREPQGMQSVLWYMLFLLEEYGSDPLATYLVDQREGWFIPVVNPDGYVYNESIAPNGGGMWRKNRRNNGGGSYGVDLNRNYPYQWGYDNDGSSTNPDSEVYRGTGPASEPETTAMVNFISSRDFSTANSTHTYSDLWLYPFGYDYFYPGNDSEYDELSQLITEVNDYTYGPIAVTLYQANGNTVDYDHAVHDTMCWTAEIGGGDVGFWPPSNQIVPLAQENLLAYQRTALPAGGWVRVLNQTINDSGGDGYYEPNDIVSFTFQVRNSGRQSTGSAVELRLESSSPWVSILDGQVSLGSIGPFTDDNNAFSPLRLQIDPSAPAGTAVDYRTVVAYEDYDQVFDGVMVIGRPVPYALDDVEIDLGWQLGAPGDNPSTGQWVRDNPEGTDYLGDECSPENDSTPGSGTDCFITGNGGGSAGNDDVDGGPVTLITPDINVADVSEAYISYDRWFANLGSPADDSFVVSISNDGGGSWQPLETVDSNANQWTTFTFRVADYVTPTDEVRLRFRTEDDPNNSLTEGGIDELRVEIYDTTPKVNAYGRPRIGTPVRFNVTGSQGDSFTMLLSLGIGDYDLPGAEGKLLLDPTGLILGFSGTIPAGRLSETTITIPNDAGSIGVTIYFQAAVTSGSTLYLTNRDDITIE